MLRIIYRTEQFSKEYIEFALILKVVKEEASIVLEWYVIKIAQGGKQVMEIAGCHSHN